MDEKERCPSEKLHSTLNILSIDQISEIDSWGNQIYSRALAFVWFLHDLNAEIVYIFKAIFSNESACVWISDNYAGLIIYL